MNDKLTPEEARAMLADIDQVARRMRNTLAASSLGPNLAIWGLVWMAGFASSYFWPDQPGKIWTSLLTVGMIFTFIFNIWIDRQKRVTSEAERQLGWQMLLFWLTIFAFASALLFALRPKDGRDVCLLFVVFSMMAYVIMGIWLKSLPLALIGLGVALATFVGRFAVSEQVFAIWMAVFGGGGLFFSGLYIQWRWR